MKNKNTTAPTSKKQDKAAAEILKIGIDIHKSKYVVVCQSDNEAPRAPQKFAPEAFLVWIGKRAKEVGEIRACYEAGCFGYVLHRKLERIGVSNLVVRPRDWDVPRSERDDTQGKRRHTARR